MAQVLHIVLFKTRMYFTSSARPSLRTVVGILGSLVVFGGFAAGAYAMTYTATTYLLDHAHLGLFLLHRFLSMIFFVFFLSVNAGNMIVSYATLYRSQETEYLLTKPLSHESVFVVRFLDNFFYSSALLFLIGIAVMFGYGTYFHAGWLFYAKTLVLEFLPFMMIAGTLGVTLLMVLMQLASKVRIPVLVASVVGLYVASLAVFFTSSNPMELVDSVMKHYPRVDEYFAQFDPAFARFLPSHWYAESLYWTARGEMSSSWPYTLGLVSAALASTGIMVATASRLFYPTWLASLSLRGAAAAARARSAGARWLSLLRPGRIDRQASVLVRKELTQFVREPSQWIHLGTILVLIAAFVTSIVRLDLVTNLPLYQTISYLVVLVFNAFLIAAITLRFVYPLVSSEGESFWSVLSAPVRREKVYMVKFLLAAVPIASVSLVLAVFSHIPLRQHPMLGIAAAVIMVCTSFALAGLNLGAGTFFANFRERNPIKVASSQSATLTFLICMVYLVVLVGIVFTPLLAYFSHVLRQAPFAPGQLWFAVAAVVAISVTLTLASTILGYWSLRRDF